MSTESEDGKVAVRPVTDTGEEYAAFKIEQRGIDLIPDAEKKMKPPGLFWLWLVPWVVIRHLKQVLASHLGQLLGGSAA